MAKRRKKTQEIREEFTDWAESAEVIQEDGTAPVIRNVVLLGPVSRRDDGSTRRRYPRSTLEAALQKFDGRQIYVDHRRQVGERVRPFREMIGVARNPRIDAEGRLRGDLCLDLSEDSRKVAWWAKNQPGMLGMSAHMGGRLRNHQGVEIAESLETVHSLDLVTQPATTRGLFEDQSERGDDMNFETLTLQELEEHCPALIQTIRDGVKGDTRVKELEAKNAELVEQIATTQKAGRKVALDTMLEGLPVVQATVLREMIGDEMPLDKAAGHVKTLHESLGGSSPKSTEKSDLPESKKDEDKAASPDEVNAALSG